MKAIIVIASLEIGGAERVASILSNNWIKQNNEVEIILLTNAEIFYDIDPRIKVTKFHFKVNSSGVSKLFALIKLSRAFRKYLKCNDADFILSFMNKYNIFTLCSLLGLGKKIIVSERDSPTEKLPIITSFLRNITYRKAHGVITQSSMSKSFIKAVTGNTNVISIPNPIQLDITETVHSSRENIILNVGRLVHKKGQKYLLEAFAQTQSRANWKIYFIGDGPLKHTLEELAIKLKIENNVCFKGFTKDVKSYYERAKIFAFPSIFEGFPNALAEAMVSGNACVSFDCDTGPRDIIDDGTNGFLIENKNIEMFAKKLQLLMNSDELINKMSHEAQKIKEKVDPKFICEEYLNFCKS